MGFIDELGILGLASRLERLSDTLKKDAVKIYKDNGLMKYKWYPVLFVLSKNPGIGVIELAIELSYAHPSIIQILKELEAQKLVRSVQDKSDNRKRLLSLTAKGLEMVNEILPFTDAFRKALTELTKTPNDLLQAINEVEEGLEDKSFYKRVKKIVENN